MVNTFITSWDIDETARSLDYRRLGKQRVEAYQIWRALKGITKGWRNHPAARAWEGYQCDDSRVGSSRVPEQYAVPTTLWQTQVPMVVGVGGRTRVTLCVSES